MKTPHLTPSRGFYSEAAEDITRDLCETQGVNGTPDVDTYDAGSDLRALDLTTIATLTVGFLHHSQSQVYLQPRHEVTFLKGGAHTLSVTLFTPLGSEATQ